LFDNGSLLDEVPEEQGIAVEPVPEEIEDMKVGNNVFDNVLSAGDRGLFSSSTRVESLSFKNLTKLFFTLYQCLCLQRSKI
jgi:hypothetical protein